MRVRSCLAPTASSSLPAEGLIESLYNATTLHALHEAVKGHALLALSLLKCREIFGILRKRCLHCRVNHVRNRLIVGRGSQAQCLVNFGLKIDRSALRGTHGVDYGVLTP